MSSPVSRLLSVVTLANSDLLMVVQGANTLTPTSKKSAMIEFFSMIPCDMTLKKQLKVSGNTTFNGVTATINSNTSIHGNFRVKNLTVANNMFTVTTSHSAPANSTSGNFAMGSIFWDTNYIYVATAANTVKRAALSAF